MLLTSGCASTAYRTSSEPLPATVNNHSYDGGEVVVIKRSSTLTGAACKLDVSINNMHIARLHVSDSVEVKLPYGEYLIDLEFKGGGLCLLSTPHLSKYVEIKQSNIPYRYKADVISSFMAVNIQLNRF